MPVERMHLSAMIAEQPHIEAGRIEVAVLVIDDDTGQRWTGESDLSDGPPARAAAVPRDVAKAAEDVLYLYLVQDGQASMLRRLRSQLTPHRQGVVYRPNGR